MRWWSPLSPGHARVGGGTRVSNDLRIGNTSRFLVARISNTSACIIWGKYRAYRLRLVSVVVVVWRYRNVPANNNWFVYLLRWAKISLKHSLVSGVCSLVGAHQIFGKETRRHLTGSLQRQQNSKAIDTVLCSPVLFLFVSMLLIFPRWSQAALGMWTF